jgi:sensor histidine kinase YesM
VTWDDSSLAWAIEIVSQLRDPVTDEYLGVIKASFDYGSFIQDLVYVEALDFYEIKVTDQEGRILATSIEDKTKVNNVFFQLSKYPYFATAMRGPDAWLEGPAVDENEKSVYVGAAISLDINEHVVLVSMLSQTWNSPSMHLSAISRAPLRTGVPP